MGLLPVQSLSDGYYLGLLTSEYRNSSKFISWLDVVINIASDISNCLTFIDTAFDIDFAIGAQLDALGLIVGVSRQVPFQPSNAVSPILDDETFRLLIRATIASNQWDGRIISLYPIWENLFPGGQITIINNQNMSATILMTGSFSSIIQDLITNEMIVPRPQAVQYDYVFGDLPFFGFGFKNEFISGFGTGKWG